MGPAECRQGPSGTPDRCLYTVRLSRARGGYRVESVHSLSAVQGRGANERRCRSAARAGTQGLVIDMADASPDPSLRAVSRMSDTLRIAHSVLLALLLPKRGMLSSSRSPE